MSTSEFESLVAAFLEGNASEAQVARLRAALGRSPELRARFQSRVRLHKAQLSFLSRREERSLSGVMTWLHGYGQRMGRSFAHLCLLALVLVELQVTIPAEYSGLLSYVDAPAAEETVLGGAELPLRLLTDAVQDFDLSQSVEVPDLTMPNFVMPDMAMPADEPTAVEV
ncbi:MAG: hypothetical protein EBY07_16365 [Actinobacteria bacterium]|jgi:hypothetical protein|nr:hypothetical protein [Actinomycetota bacterium]